MKQYFTSLMLKDGKYTGTIYDPNTNLPVYVSREYDQQIDANIDVAEYMKSLIDPPTIPPDPNKPHPLPRVMHPPRKCCGRN